MQRLIMKKYALFLFIAIMAIGTSVLSYIICTIPEKIMLSQGDEYIFSENLGYLLKSKVRSHGVSKDGTVTVTSDSIQMKADNIGRYDLDISILGVIPVKTVQVNVTDKIELIPGGNTIGVNLNMNGALVVGVSEMTDVQSRIVAPARDAGLQNGDIIKKINGKNIETVKNLSDIVEHSQGTILTIEFLRNGKTQTTKLNPELSEIEKEYKIGAWVRDSTSGIGTITFYNPQIKTYGALGHGITDYETGEIIKSNSGNILKSSITSIQKGEKGQPGELKGIFLNEENSLGSVFKNCEYGLFGSMKDDFVESEFQKPMEILYRTQIKEGKAYILSNIEGEKVDKYEIEIQKVMSQSSENSKGMIIKILDERLLEKTGGIVQGMSGSPIIQDNKIAGAVTHVFVNDPTRGYGIFIEWMLRAVGEDSVQSPVAA